MEVYSDAEDRNWSVVSIVSFWKVMGCRVGSISFIAEKMVWCAFNTFRIVLPLEGLSWSVTGMMIILFTMTAVVPTSIVRCVMVMFDSGRIWLFNVITSVFVCFSLFLYWSWVVSFSLDGGVLLVVSKLMVFLLRVFSISTSSSIISKESEGWMVVTSSGFVLV